MFSIWAAFLSTLRWETQCWSMGISSSSKPSLGEIQPIFIQSDTWACLADLDSGSAEAWSMWMSVELAISEPRSWIAS